MQPAAPAVRDLVLVGAGHSHVQVLRRFGMRPEPGVRLTVIAREVHTPYSGMLPGHVAGRYDRDQMHIDVARLARFADARLIPSEVTGLDLDGQRVRMGDRPPLRYDILSLNTGGVPGEGYAQRSYVTPVKPIGRFLPRWNAVCEELARRPMRLVLVGGGPGSVELALAMRARFPDTARCTLVTAGPGTPGGARARRAAQAHGTPRRPRGRGPHRLLRRSRGGRPRPRARRASVAARPRVLGEGGRAVRGVPGQRSGHGPRRFRGGERHAPVDVAPRCLRGRGYSRHAGVATAEVRRLRGAAGSRAGRQPAPACPRPAPQALPCTAPGPRPDRYRGRSRRRVPGSLACIGPLGVGLEGLDRPGFHAPLPGTAGDGGRPLPALAPALGVDAPGRDALRGLRAKLGADLLEARPAAVAGPSGPGHAAGPSVDDAANRAAAVCHARHDLRRLPRDGGTIPGASGASRRITR